MVLSHHFGVGKKNGHLAIELEILEGFPPVSSECDFARSEKPPGWISMGFHYMCHGQKSRFFLG